MDDLDIALHDFVNKDDKAAFYSCLQRNLEETRVLFPLDCEVLVFSSGYQRRIIHLTSNT